MKVLKKVSDGELLPLLRSGDNAAFKELFERYHTEVYTFLYKFLKSPELTEDITQEIFIKVWDNRETLPELTSVKSYLFTIGRNHAFNFLKRAGVDKNAKAEILKYYSTDGNSLENGIHARDYQRYLNELLDKLTPQSREIFRLCRQEGKSYDETAELLGISRNTVKKHMVRSMRILSDTIEKDLGLSLTTLLLIVSYYRP
jgi:RNA polymerase sigma-70 factor (family 1)